MLVQVSYKTAKCFKAPASVSLFKIGTVRYTCFQLAVTALRRKKTSQSLMQHNIITFINPKVCRQRNLKVTKVLA